MTTENAVNKSSRQVKRVFKVGVVGASAPEFNIISRIFTVTQYRTRCYQPRAMASSQHNNVGDIDFVLMCSSNPTIIQAWEKRQKNGREESPPLIFLTRGQSSIGSKYRISSPVNPGKFIKLLDHYTIKELNFFPEFEIGHDTHELQSLAISGLRMLRSSDNSNVVKIDKPTRALVVDDSLAVRKQMQIEFELLQDQLDVVENAEKAMEAIKKKTYDIIFLDVVMPGMDGYSACKQIKRSKLNKNTPVILLTSRSSSFDKIKGTLAGCDAYLVKPINHNEFETVYKKHINRTKGETHASS